MAHNIPHNIAQWGYALAVDAHAGDIELTPNLQPLTNGDDVIGPNGSYYMGGVNNGEGLNEDEPAIQQDHADNESEIFVWFSDEEFAPRNWSALWTARLFYIPLSIQLPNRNH
ncbi:hypothetical protein B0H14DRAFT_2616260 [Mycena olivaceomarginata]|nr:hypothetical protein B0H14DRAFT_2616260 [Mycena olivaceomarginata]